MRPSTTYTGRSSLIPVMRMPGTILGACFFIWAIWITLSLPGKNVYPSATTTRKYSILSRDFLTTWSGQSPPQYLLYYQQTALLKPHLLIRKNGMIKHTISAGLALTGRNLAA